MKALDCGNEAPLPGDADSGSGPCWGPLGHTRTHGGSWPPWTPGDTWTCIPDMLAAYVFLKVGTPCHTLAHPE